MSPMHVMRYHAGLALGSRVVGMMSAGGDRAIGTEPGWSCSCGRFWHRAQAMPHRKTGNNKIEAERAFAKHAGAPLATPQGD